jgi:tetratricopeptide (TPR) repeat protein
MTRRTLTLGLVTVIGLGTGLAVVARRAPARLTVDAAAEAAAAELAIHEADIGFYQRRVAADPFGAADRAMLGSLLLQRARETGNYDYYIRAEHVARRSLAIRTSRNARAYAILTSSLLAQHRFVEALAAARALRALEPDSRNYAALEGEIESELGDYDAARRTFDGLRTASADLSVAPRLARWAELNGRDGEARHLLANALWDASRRMDLAREQKAWFALRLGDLEVRAGRLDAAGVAYRQGLGFFPGDYRLEAAMARLESLRGHPREAIRHGENAIARVLEPGTLGVLSDAYAAVGHAAKAEQYLRVMELAVAGQAGPIHRQWSLFLLDHDRDVALVADKARRELRTRHDIYGWDVYAWALHHQGREREARAAMDSALHLGTRDPLLQHHRAVIDSALGAAGAR